MNQTLELVDGYIFARCKVCGEQIQLAVTESGPMWELAEADVGYNRKMCPKRLALGNPARYGPGMTHVPEFK